MPTGKGDVIRATAELVSPAGRRGRRADLRGAELRLQRRHAPAGTAVNVVPDLGHGAGHAADLHRRAAGGGVRPARSAVRRDRATAQGVTVDLELPEHTPAVVNDAAVTDVVEAAARAVLGGRPGVPDAAGRPSDDVSEFLNHLPGCYFFVGGAVADGSSGMHHSPTFSVEDESLRVGATWCRAAPWRWPLP